MQQTTVTNPNGLERRRARRAVKKSAPRNVTIPAERLRAMTDAEVCFEFGLSPRSGDQDHKDTALVLDIAAFALEPA